MIANRFIKNEMLSRHTNFRIGGPAKYFCEARSSDEIIKAVQWAHEHGESFFVLGGGSNVLVSDHGFDGLVIKTANRHFEILDSTSVHVEAGALSAFIARKTAEAGLTGFLWAVSLPGTIGGAVRGNAGCFGGEMKDVIKRVRVLRIKNPHTRASSVRGRQELRIKELSDHECEFNYRDSIFKRENPVSIILSAELELKKYDPKKCLERVQQNLAKRKEKQPLEALSAGCIFKNYELSPDVKSGSRPDLSRLKHRERRESKNQGINLEPPGEFIKQKMIPAGWLVEQAGLLGLKVGNAEVSTKHGNFVLNRGRASAQDVVDLVRKIKDKVNQKFGVELQEEVQYVGF